MARTLNVFFDREFVGKLTQDDGGQMIFQYGESWLAKDAPMALSRSLPLRPEPFSQKECRGFFGGTLPEEGSRKVIARILGISDKNDFAMLEQIGGECAGAITFLPEEREIPDEELSYRDLTDEELARILRELPRRPLMAGEEGVRVSLAGAQHKIAVRLNGDTISIPRGSAPSSHILKPAVATYAGVVYDEAFCMKLAAACGLNVAPVSIGHVEDIDYLLAERYDRIRNEDGTVTRLHQEDFCQALGIPSDHKYQVEGGPGLPECFELVREASTAPALDVIALLDAVIFNLLIGNYDAHGKNFSLLYPSNGSIRLAPLYDLVSTIYYPELVDTMAMKIGTEAKSELILPEHVARFAKETGLGGAQTLARAASLAERLLDEIPGVEKPDEVSEAVAALIVKRSESFRSRFRKK
jgi:serine/threonine-protein kinase HipA